MKNSKLIELKYFNYNEYEDIITEAIVEDKITLNIGSFDKNYPELNDMIMLSYYEQNNKFTTDELCLIVKKIDINADGSCKLTLVNEWVYSMNHPRFYHTNCPCLEQIEETLPDIIMDIEDDDNSSTDESDYDDDNVELP